MSDPVTRVTLRNLVGPLTTTFTPPASCSDLTFASNSEPFSYEITYDSFYYRSGGSGVLTSTGAYEASHAVKYKYELDSDCVPPGTWRQYMYGTTYWSPGICPSAWTTADFYVRDAETTVNCCPPNYDLRSTSWCMSTITSAYAGSAVVYVNSERVDETPTPTDIGTQRVYVTPVQIRFRDTDSAVLASASATPSSASTPDPDTADLTSSSTADLTSTSSPPSPASPTTAALASQSTSAGTKIGIGIGVRAIALGILCFSIFV